MKTQTIGYCAAIALVALGAFVVASVAASPDDFRVVEARSLAEINNSEVKPGTIVFSDRQTDKSVDPVNGLISFEDWTRARPLQKQLLSPYPSYTEPTVNTTVNGAVKAITEKLHIYEAQARFILAHPPQSLDLSRFSAVSFLERIDPAITHKTISTTDLKPTWIRNPDREWCDTKSSAICLQSRYNFEGKLPTAIHLANQLMDSKKKIADYLEFESELRILTPSDFDQGDLRKLTGIDAPVLGGMEQTIFHVNQLMQFGKLLVVIQQNPMDSGQSIVSAFVALAVKTKSLESKKKYESVPVLRNLVPAQVLVGKSSFNSGRSISAGLPIYARNEIRSVAKILAGD
jgi:hypothetical protein